MDKKPSKDEQVGFHKGALSTLAKEREELSRMTQVVEQLMRMHMKALQGLDANGGEDAGQGMGKSDKKK
jgi:hypothetical protein